MKKNIVTIITALSLLSCGGSNNTTPTEDKTKPEVGNIDTPTESTTTVNEDEATAEHPESEDHYAIWKMDSTNEVNFKTSHLIAMQLCGHVKHVETSDKCSFDFDANGKMTRYDDGQGELQVMNEPDEESLNLYVPGGACSYGIDLKNKRLNTYTGGEYSYSWEFTYVYDANGKLQYVNEHVTERDEVNGKEQEKETNTKSMVQVLEADHHGNWTKMKYGERIKTRTISYHDNPIGGFEETGNNPMNCTLQLTGSIGGDNNCTFALANGEGTYKNAYGTRLTKAVAYTNGQLKVEAYDSKSKAQIGYFEGSFTSTGSQMVYKGVFTNIKTGGKVDFNLKN